jgi:hypothetical protein
MNGVGQTGHVEVKENTVDFFGGALNFFAGGPKMVELTCPNVICNHRFEIEENKLLGISQLQCPMCKGRYSV